MKIYSQEQYVIEPFFSRTAGCDTSRSITCQYSRFSACYRHNFAYRTIITPRVS